MNDLGSSTLAGADGQSPGRFSFAPQFHLYYTSLTLSSYPIWTSVHGDENDRPIGEIGTLQQLSIGVLLDTSLF